MPSLHLQRHDAVSLLVLDQEGENRLHPDLVAAFLETLDACECDPGVRALVVTGGESRFFSNGLDLPWLLQHIEEPETILAYIQSVNALFRRICVYPKPIVGALNGHTFAAGVFLAAHMDFRLMREDRGWVCLPEVNIDIPLLPGMVAIMRAVTLPAGFREMYFTGRRFTGPEARDLGFVDRCLPAADLLPRALALAAELGTKNTRTYAEMKRRLRADVVRVLDEEDPPLFLSTLMHAVPR
jgi:enoyl-CoA hydratase